MGLCYLGVVAASEMQRLERLAFDQGAKPESFMIEAGRAIAKAAARRIGTGKKIGILVGKGNNGGDGFAAGIRLLEMGYTVTAFTRYKDGSPLNQVFFDRFKQAGGRVETGLNLEGIELIIDGLLGTGFQGELGHELREWIERANSSGIPIVAIDIPSGLNGNTGEAEIAIRAIETVALGFAKIGFFLRKGWNWVGAVHVAEFGLPDSIIQKARLAARIPRLETLELPKVERVRHKYERGLVVGFGGSKQYAGAIKLSGKAALHSGAGIVKLFSLESIGPVEDELICQIWSEEEWGKAVNQAKSVFIGPGMGRSEEAREWLRAHLGRIGKPCIVDADALFFLTKLKEWPASAIVTPHRGEMREMLGGSGDVSLEEAQKFVEKHRIVLVLKGAPTFVLAAGEIPIVAPWGDPGMATAGAGDVLTGILASMIAQGKGLYEGAILGVVLHALAGEAAALRCTSFSVTAHEIIESLPSAFNMLLHQIK